MKESNSDVSFVFPTNDKQKNISKFIDKRPQFSDLDIIKYDIDSTNEFLQQQTIPTTYIINRNKDFAIKITGAQNFSTNYFNSFFQTIKN